MEENNKSTTPQEEINTTEQSNDAAAQEQNYASQGYSEDEQYDEEEYSDYDSEELQRSRKSLKGYKIIVGLLTILLIGISILSYTQTKQIKETADSERDAMTNELTAYRDQCDLLLRDTTELSAEIRMERNRIDSLLEVMQKERSSSQATIRRYQKEINTMRAVMREYVHQIDSLNKINKQLGTENASLRQNVATQTRRAEMAEEKVDEMALQVRQGSVIRVRDINLVMLNNKDKELKRGIKRAERLRADMTLSSNDIANPGARNIYIRITAPDGFVLATEESKSFTYEGDELVYSAMREVDYQGSDLGVSIYYNGSSFTEGEYKVDVYVDGHLSGSGTFLLK